MNEAVISKFHVFYYVKGIFGSIIVLMLAGYTIRLCLSHNLADPANVYFATAFCITLLVVYYYYFSKSWKKITVTPTEIILEDVVFKKQLRIPYAAITGIETYRRNSDNLRGWVFSQNFIFEYDGNKSVAINEDWFDNYDQLTMAIYKYKYGPGQGRERYEERRKSG
jgi:hypothetical protein